MTTSQKAKILIVVPNFVTRVGDFYQFPLGLAYIAGAIKAVGYEVQGLNLNYIDEDESVAVERYVRENSIDIVMSGALSSFLPSLQKVFKGARAGNKNVLNIVGGGIVGADPVVAPKIMDIDLGVIGEGEEAVIEILTATENGTRDWAAITGLVYRENGEVKQTPNRSTHKDIDTLAWPEYGIFNIKEHIEGQGPLDHHFFQTQQENAPRSIDMITSRSCPFMCTFCFHPVGKSYRERSVDDVVAELKVYKEKYNINMVSILDELFSLRRPRLFEFCEKIKHLNLQWMVQLHVRTADAKVLKAMKESGCVYVSYGIESADEAVLKSMAKKSTVLEIDHALQMTYDAKIGIQGNLIFGDTAETLETANNSFQWWARNRQYQIYLSKLQVFPGSPDYIMSVRDGLITDRTEFSIQLPDNLNISNTNNTNLSAMMFQLKVHGRTLLNAVKAEFQKSGDQMDIVWDCPRCEHHNSYEDVRLRPEHHHFIRLFCRDCHSRFDIINELFENNVRESNPALLGGGSVFDQKKIKPVVEDKKHLVSEAYRIEDRHPNAEVDHYGRILLNAPFEPRAHYDFAMSLLKIYSNQGAAMHLEQAINLLELLQASLTDEHKQFIETAQREVKQIEESDPTCFVAISDAEPPYRESRKTDGYVNKNEPDFPDFKSMNVSRKRIPGRTATVAASA